MRLSQNQAVAIHQLVKEVLGSNSKVWLFGSRVDDRKRGGDIDLYIESTEPCDLSKKLALMTKVQHLVGLRRVDMLVKTPTTPDRAIYATAKLEGLLL